MDERPQKEFLQEILDAFPNSTCIGVKKEYNLGLSGSWVFAVEYKPEYEYDSKIISGLKGTYVIKIGDEKWSRGVKDFYRNLPRNDETRTLIIPYHMRSCPINGYRGVAFGVAFESVLKPQPLLNILDERTKGETETQKQIEDLSKSLVKWYLTNKTETSVMNPYTLLINLLTPERAEKVATKIKTAYPHWKLSDPQLNIDGLKDKLPNPLVYLQKDSWAGLEEYNPTCISTNIHGDLHTGNVICYPQSSHTPMLIDFDQSTENGVPFFDLAYLEFDIIRHILPIDKPENRESLLSLLSYSMKSILGGQASPVWDEKRAWDLILPLRRVVNRLQEAGGEDSELVWWLATVAVGLNYAQKGNESRPPFERLSGLIYAAFGLVQALAIIDPNRKHTGSACHINWLDKDTDSLPQPDSSPSTTAHTNINQEASQNPIPLPVNSVTSPASGSNESAKNNPASKPAASSEIPSISNNSLSLKTEAEQPSFDHRETLHNLQTEGSEILGKLTKSVNNFNQVNTIFQDVCIPVENALKKLEDFFKQLSTITKFRNPPGSFPLTNVKSLQRQILSSMHNFKLACPPGESRSLTKKQYEKEIDDINQNIQKLLRDVNSILQEL